MSAIPASPTAGHRRRKQAVRIGTEVLWHLTMITICIIILIPIFLVILGSFKSVPEFFQKPYGWPESFNFDNYRKAWEEANIPVTLRNSVIVTVAGVFVSTAVSCLAAYALGRFVFSGRMALRMLFVGGLVVPVQLIILPLFIILREIGLLGDLKSLILIYSAFGIPAAVLILTGFFAALPRDLEDAARIDGASHFEVFWRIMLPLTRPALSAVIILNGVWMWNDFFLGFILLNDPDQQTLPVGIMSFRGTYSTQYGLIFASVTMSAIPIVLAYLALSRQFIAGLTAGSVKG